MIISAHLIKKLKINYEWRFYHLEINSGRQDAQQSADSINRYKRKTVFVQAKHHLQTAGNRLDVFIVLNVALDYIKSMSNERKKQCFIQQQWCGWLIVLMNFVNLIWIVSIENESI